MELLAACEKMPGNQPLKYARPHLEIGLAAPPPRRIIRFRGYQPARYECRHPAWDVHESSPSGPLAG